MNVRRVITGHDKKNVAKVIVDGNVTNLKLGKVGNTVAHVWNTNETPAAMPVGEDVEDTGLRPHVIPPPKNGTRFVVIDFPAGGPGMMHRTETIDYVIVMEGEIDMDMDDSTVHMKAGDVMVQRGTNHAWWNRSSKNARVAFVLVDGQPLGFGAPVL
jgi:quercetin dioxygenase-like cupin family protein